MTQETLKNLLPKFIKDLENKSRSPSTILAYRADLEQLISFVEGKQKIYPEQIGQEFIEAFRDSLLSQKYTPKTVSRKLNAVKTFFRFLLSEGYLTKDPSLSVAHPQIETSFPKCFSPLQYRALRDVVRDDRRVAAIVELILQTGMRISEVGNLKINNIKAEKVTIEAYATQAETTFIIQNLKAGVDLVLLSQVVGHKRLSTTERYLSLAEVKEPGKKQVLEEL